MVLEIPILAKGEFPHAGAGVVQVVDDAALDAVAGQAIPAGGILLDFDHYSDLTEEERAALKEMGIVLPSEAAGWLKRFARRGDKVFAVAELTPKGAESVEGKEYRFTSPTFDWAGLEDLGGGRVRPKHVEKVGLTNEPNMRAIGAILANRRTWALANKDEDVEWRMIGGHPVPIKDGESGGGGGEEEKAEKKGLSEKESAEYREKNPVSAWHPGKDPGKCDPDAARKEIEGGVELDTPIGVKLTADKSAIEHWDTGGKSKEEIARRLGDWERCKAALSDPNEVWEDERGLVFLQLTADGTGKRRMMNAFAYDRTSKVATWYHYNKPRDFESHRRGRLLYKKRAPSEGIHPGAANRGAPDAGTALGNGKSSTEALEVKRIDAEVPATDKPDNGKQNGENMELEKLAEMLGCEATVEAVEAALAALKEKAAKADEKPAAGEDGGEKPAVGNAEGDEDEDAEKEELKNRVAKLEAELKQSKVDAELAKHPAVKNRKAAEAVLSADWDAGVKMLAELDAAHAAGGAKGANPEDKLANRAGGDGEKDELTGQDRVVAALKNRKNH